MYHLTVTVKQYSLHTSLFADLYEVDESDRRTQKRMAHVYIPQPNGALFALDEGAFMEDALREIQKCVNHWLDTEQ